MNSEDSSTPAVHCLCVDTCVGLDCLKRRSNALVSLGRPHQAHQLLQQALEDDQNAASKNDLRALQQALPSGSRRELSRTHSGLSSDDRDMRTPQSEKEERDGGGTDPSMKERGHDSPMLRTNPGKRRRVDDSIAMSALVDMFDCVLCSKLLFEPVTTPCGHTFCRTCLSRAMDFTDCCPLCRTVLHLEDPSTIPITNVLRNAIQQCFAEEYDNRRIEVEGDGSSAENAMNRLPLFPLNAVVFPMQRFPMHIFEPRYRLMLRRIMQSSRKFGLIALKRTRDGSLELRDVGCVLEVTKADRFPDGRSLIETVARERFKVHAKSEVDGYLVGRTEPYHDDENTDTEEVREVEAKVRSIVEKLMEKGSRVPTMQHALQRAGDVPTKSKGPDALGMWLAGMLVSDDNERQNMLEMRDSAKRLKDMMAILERFKESAAATATANGDSGRECTIQ